MAGRKSLKEEIKIVERLTALSEPTFSYIKGMYDSGDKPDKKWAVEQMMKLYAKCIPTELTGDPENPIPILQVTKPYVPTNDSDSENTENVEENQSSTRGDISE